MVNWNRGALVYVHSAICEMYIMLWYSIDLWSIVGVHLPWVYVHSSICETYMLQWYSIDLWPIGGGALVYLHSAISETYLVQWYSIDPWSIGGGRYICPGYMCILLYVKLIWCSGFPQIYGLLEEGYICPGYMCILLHVKLIWCSGIPQIQGQLEQGVHSYICILLYHETLFGVVVLYRAMVNWRRRALVYVHSAISETYLVQWYYIDPWFNWRREIHLCPGYMWIILIHETYIVQWYSIDLWSI